MSQVYGIEKPPPHHEHAHRKPARWLVVIDAGGVPVARLFVDTFEQVAEFDAGAEEVARLTEGRHATTGALGPAWERALDGHSAAERVAARVYTLDI